MTLRMVRLAGKFTELKIDLAKDPSPTICANGIGSVGKSYAIVNDGRETKDEDMALRVIRTKGSFGEFKVDCAVDPSPTIDTLGVGGAVGYAIIEDGRPSPARAESDKPPYRIPTLAEVAEIEPNGYTVASTFSGAGGSCLGYRMAGFRVAWANEFVPIAQESYRANCAPGSILDVRDIRMVQPEEILEAIGIGVGELDVFDGSPPCQAFSTAGKREKNWGTERVYDHGVSQKNETLFFEYTRLLRGLQPKVFVAENVSGLVKGSGKGFFLEIIRDMREAGYRVQARVVDARWLGIPQSRLRVIFVGVREDLGLDPVFPLPFPYGYSVLDAIPWLSSTTCDPRGRFPIQEFSDGPHGAITTQNKAHVTARTKAGERRKLTIEEVKLLCSFPEDFQLAGNYDQQWERLGNSVPPLMMRAVALAIRDGILSRIGKDQDNGTKKAPKKGRR